MRSFLPALGLAVAALGATPGQAVPTAPKRPCATPEYRQFDFFVGDWDVFDIDAPTKMVARLTATKILDGCAIHEDYRQEGGLRGESYSLYDASVGRWHQSWVTNRGVLILLDGGRQGDRMVLTGKTTGEHGDSSLLRGTWIPREGGVRETAVSSADGGRTWKPAFDILLRPHREGTAK